MRQEPVDPVGRYRELGVVAIVGMNADAVGERREPWCHPAITADDRCGALRKAEIIEVTPHQLGALGDGTRQRYDEVADKFRECAEFAHFPRARAAEVVGMVRDLETLSSIDRLTRVLLRDV